MSAWYSAKLFPMKRSLMDEEDLATARLGAKEASEELGTTVSNVGEPERRDSEVGESIEPVESKPVEEEPMAWYGVLMAALKVRLTSRKTMPKRAMALGRSC